jgi:uncharacterized protein (TIGR02231 family)
LTGAANLGRVTESAPAPTETDVALEAPIVAVTVFPDRARVTRRGGVRLPAGEHRVVLGDLPLALQADSVRVAGTGPATVLGVDVAPRHRPRPTDDVAVDLIERLRQARDRLTAIEDDDAVLAGRLEFLDGLARRATRSYATALAEGQSDPERVAALADALAAQQAEVRRGRRDLTRLRVRTAEEIGALERELAGRSAQRQPDRQAVVVTLAVADAATSPDDAAASSAAASGTGSEVELDVSYLVYGAGWRSAYDLRLDGDSLTVTWFGLVTQRTEEDWPECDLRLSTARPSGSLEVPELDPWFLDRVRPVPPPAPRGATGVYDAEMYAMAAQPAQPAADRAIARAAVRESVATVEQGATAATYRPARPVAVPADGTAHRATVAVERMQARRDYVTAPVLAAEAQLRATVSNTSPHTLPAGRAAVFQGADFVGSTHLDVWAPGEEVELALGIDDRVRVERELVRRTAAKAVLGGDRRREAEHRITLTNHTPGEIQVTVLDQLPVSRDDGIVVKERRLEPPPTQRTDMGTLTWVLDLAPGASRDIFLGVRVELARGVEVAGWRE